MKTASPTIPACFQGEPFPDFESAASAFNTRFTGTLPNGVTVSLIFGGKVCYGDGVNDFEVAFWDPDGNWCNTPEDDDVWGCQTAEQVADLCRKAAALTFPAPAEKPAATPSPSLDLTTGAVPVTVRLDTIHEAAEAINAAVAACYDESDDDLGDELRILCDAMLFAMRSGCTPVHVTIRWPSPPFTLNPHAH